MCGIVGVSGLERAAELVSLGLYALQHRGQEAAGIAAIDNGRARVHKAAGLVAEAIDDDVLKNLPGTTALGHVRYSTSGGPGLVNAQPIVVRYHQGDLAVVHNGNITNARILREKLVAEGALFQSSTDTEVLVHLIARSRESTPEAQLRDALRQLEGAFSVIVTIGSVLYAARDPWGFRPLILGRRGGGYVLASETCALDLLGAEYVRDLEPGELIRIDGDQVTRLGGLAPASRLAPCIFELIYFARPDSKLWGISVDRARRALGRQLAREQPAEADCVFSVPDSSNSAALGYAEESGIPFELGLIRNHYVGRTFIHPTQVGRDFRVRVKYNPVREVIEGKRVVVVDDSLVRGTTSRGLVSLIRDAGAREIHFRVASPPVRSPCFFGIDMPTREELIGARLSVDAIRESLGVDSLGYLSIEGMHAALREVKGASSPFCDACFSGSYPAPLSDVERGYVNHRDTSEARQ
ncbi:MAG: amidophosphoribosyltransferase [bacterium]|jgi:amidophosphoribosyltransferase|nr:MAG: amidophosphoribosyltransferase [bacterium]